MSLTRFARRANSCASSAGRPNSLTSVAPGAEKRSVICDVMAALCSVASRSSAPTLAPTRRAGITKIGSNTSASTVICHDKLSITTTVRTRAMRLVTTPDNAEVNARWAPITSLFNRLTSAPVWVRVKNAIGMLCTCSNTRRRRSRMSPSPSRDDCCRSRSPTTESTTAIAPISTASPTTVAVACRSTMRVDRPAGQHWGGDAEHALIRSRGRGTRRSCAGVAWRTRLLAAASPG